MKKPTTAILHYTAPPIIGGVEVVIEAHVHAFIEAGYPVTVIAGRGEVGALSEAAEFVHIPEIDTRHPRVTEVRAALRDGRVPDDFEAFADDLVEILEPVLENFDNLIVHNVFTKDLNLPLTQALFRLLDEGVIEHCIAWSHDFSWTSPTAPQKVSEGYPWDLLRTQREDVTYVVVSEDRQQDLVGLFDCSPEEILVVYNGVDPQGLLGLTDEGYDFVKRLHILEQRLVLLMPVRVTRAKNIEYALEVVAALRAQEAQPFLVLTGPPDPHDEESMAYYESLRERRQELGIDDEMRFVFESGPNPDEPYTIGADVVGDLYRVSDVVLMPSHREGFGMPVLEAGLAGVAVASTPIPASVEIGGEDVLIFETSEPPEHVAGRILHRVRDDRIYRLRQRVRRKYTWAAIFEREIRPLLHREEAS